MKAHLLQLDMLWEDKLGNRAKAGSLIQQTSLSPSDLAILPEMFDTGFSFHVKQTADTDGETSRFLSATAARHRIYLHGSRTAIDGAGRAMNLASVYGPDGEALCEYEKVHPFGLGPPGEREADHFPGGAEVKTYDWSTPDGSTLRVCPVICYDLRFPELFRKGLLLGAEVFIVTTNWPSVRAGHLRALLIARAIENQAYVLCVNRTGRDPSMVYAGGSVAIDPKGEIVAELRDEEACLSVEIDPGAVREWRARFPAWRDHRLLTR
ncbi:MAG: hypothetical protein KF705_07015 [Phycisphaeraceae bacterium]|nr:hypothetical protein [Phycisphaeraceae bacterium]